MLTLNQKEANIIISLICRFALTFVIALTGCTNISQQSTATDTINYNKNSESNIESNYNSIGSDFLPINSDIQLEGEDIKIVDIQIGNKNFKANLYDNDSAKALIEKMPLTLNMNELNGNEKYCYLQNNLPNDSENVNSINTGDLMLYGSDCIVLFYKNFSTSYSYTKLGYIEDTSGLADALGSGNIQITFSFDN